MKHHFTKLTRVNVFEMLHDIGWSAVARQLSKWSDGQRGYIEIKKKAKIKSTEQLGYYYAVILPEAIEAFKLNGEIDITINVKDKKVTLPMSRDAVDLFLKVNYGAYHGEYKDKAEMSRGECAAFENWAIMWLGKWLNCQIPPADTNWRDNQ